MIFLFCLSIMAGKGWNKNIKTALYIVRQKKQAYIALIYGTSSYLDFIFWSVCSCGTVSVLCSVSQLSAKPFKSTAVYVQERKLVLSHSFSNHDMCVWLFVPGETLPLATSNQIMLRFNAKSGQSARGFHFVYQGNWHSVSLSLFRSNTHIINYLRFKFNMEFSADDYTSVFFPLLILCNGCHHCSCASHQWQSVQFSAGASVRQADRFRVLSWLCGPVRV